MNEHQTQESQIDRRSHLKLIIELMNIL